MLAITQEQPGGPETLAWREVDDPTPGAGEVVLDVVASAVNRADVLQRQGRYPTPAGASPYLGLECSGTVRSLGPGVSGWAVGDTACALLAGGGYAEQVAVPVETLLPIPDGVDLVTAGALPEVACTVWSNLVMTAGLQDGQTVLLHGGSSGIGTMAIQVCRALGARVAVTAGSTAKLDACRDLGAEMLINYREVDFGDALRDATQGRGADVILDVVGGPYLARNVDALATGGRLVIIGMQGGVKAEINLGLLLAKRAGVIGTTLRARPLAEKAAIVTAVRENVWPMIADGRVRPVVHTVLPIAQAAAGHALMESSAHIGKIVLQVR
ncbi:MAG: NAD(P)H-quinone oxidoreductase [Jiangellales bacterium]